MDDRRNDYLYGNPYLRQRAYGSYSQQVPAQVPAQSNMPVPVQNRIKQLTRAEREEARRIAEQASFTMDGFQVVRREFFSHIYEPTMTIKGNSITFNNACITKLEQAVYVQVLVNPVTEKLVIRPCEEGARDAIRWCIAKDNKRKSREITCGLFTAKLYEMMGWEAVYRYKLQGTRINYNGEQLYVFDLTSTEIFLPGVKDPNDPKARVRRQKAMYPADWRDSFGMTVSEHAASTKIDLMDGYAFADAGAKEEKVEEEQLPIEILDKETGEVILI